MSDWREEAGRRAKEKGEGTTLTIDPGVVCLRICPDKKDLLPNGQVGPKGIVTPPFREFRVHRDVGPDDAFVACGKDINGKGKCYGCDRLIPTLLNSGSESKRVAASKMEAQEQLIVQVLKLDSDTQKFTKPKIWWVSTGSGIPGKQKDSLATRLLGKFKTSKRDLVDPTKGYNINVERTGTGMRTRWPGLDVDESPSKVPASLLALAVSLDTIVPQYDEEDFKNAYLGRPRKRREDKEAESTEEEENVDSADEETGEVEEEAYEEGEETLEETDQETEESLEESSDEALEETDQDEFSDNEEVVEETEEPLEEDLEEDLPEETDIEEPEPEPEPPPRRPAATKKAAPPATTKRAPTPATTKRPAAPPPPAVKKTAPAATKKAAPVTKKR